MIGVYAGIRQAQAHRRILKIIEPLVTASRRTKATSATTSVLSNTNFAFIERWESQELLEKAHGHRALPEGCRRMGAAALLRAGRSHR